MNKIKSLFLIVFLSITLGLSAQSFNGGVLVGGIASQVNGDNYAGYHQLGWTAGAYANWPVNNDLSWQLELKYALFGSHSDVKEEEMGANHYNLRLHYAEVPIMLRYKLNRFHVGDRSLDFITLEIGPSFDFLLFFSDETNLSPNENAPWKFFSLTGNVGMHFDFGERWGIGLRSMNSIIPIRYKNSPSYFYGHYYNIVLQAVVTYNIKASHRY